MKLDLKDYEIIADGETIIGYINEVIRLYKDYAKQLIDDLSDKEELLTIYELLEKLENSKDEEYDVFLVKVFFNPMGAYQYIKYMEVE